MKGALAWLIGIPVPIIVLPHLLDVFEDARGGTFRLFAIQAASGPKLSTNSTMRGRQTVRRS